jgi:hypothetical protein
MFFGLPDPHPDPLVTSTEPAPDPAPQLSSKNRKNNLDFYCLVDPEPHSDHRIRNSDSILIHCVCSSVSSEELNSYIPRHRHIEVDLPPGCNTQVTPVLP